jgi:hypothetical protein
MTPSGIDPATFRFVAQSFDDCATACNFKSGIEVHFEMKWPEKVPNPPEVNKVYLRDGGTLYIGNKTYCLLRHKNRNIKLRIRYEIFHTQVQKIFKKWVKHNGVHDKLIWFTSIVQVVRFKGKSLRCWATSQMTRGD